MRVLAIDSSSLVASVALVDEETTIAEYTINYKKTHSQTLLPMLDEVKKMLDLDMNTIDAIAVSEGPGSFTGLRIGASTAKGLGLALDIPLVAIPTLEGMAYNLLGNNKLVCPIMDARRNQVYTGVYRVEDKVQILLNQSALDIYELMNKINSLREPVIFLGDGVPVFRDIIKEKTEVEVTFAKSHVNRQRASAYATLALSYIKNGKTISADMFRPDYLRESQAERERRERTLENKKSK
ncbi:MAG: tRNA (adenosine(37)-N6)-threonylcarbamoyltransferase complex dimerization subunit type 1 TsaB [Suipraeoptans sp.]